MSKSVVDWVAEKLGKDDDELCVVGRTHEDFLVVRSKQGYRFPVAVLGVKGVIDLSDVEPLFTMATKPLLVINVPSGALWSGDAIRYIHAASSSFGTLGDVARAAVMGDAGCYRDKNMGFFINAIHQHSNVYDIEYVYDRVFNVLRWNQPSLTVAVIDAYNMSAEDVRNARSRFGHFDLVIKSTSHGSITHQAEAAAESIGAEALTFRGLLARLTK